MNRKWVFFTFIILGFLQISAVMAEDFGKFVGTVKTEWTGLARAGPRRRPRGGARPASPCVARR